MQTLRSLGDYTAVNLDIVPKYKTHREKAVKFLEEFGVPHLSYLGVNKDTISKISMRKEAHWQCSYQKYLSVNIDFAERRKRRVIELDIDDKWEDDAWSKVIDLILEGVIPRPTFASSRIVKKGGEERRTRSHFIFPLEFPINESDPRQKFFMDVVLDEFYDILERHDVPIDRSQGVTFKNPAADEWDVFHFGNHLHSLKDWAEMFGISDLTKEEQKAANWARKSRKKAKRLAKLAGIYGERNVDVFEVSRHFAYAEKYQHSSYLTFYEAVADIVTSVHDDMGYAIGLASKELRQIIKSIAKWTWYVYEGHGYSPRDRGACASLMEDGMDQEDRQRIGAGYAHDKRAQKVLQKMRTAYDELTSAGEKISVRTWAAAACVSATTVQKYRKCIEQGEELASKAQTYASEIKTRLESISAENAPFERVCHDGVSEIPHRGLIPDRAGVGFLKIFHNEDSNGLEDGAGASQRRPEAEQPGQERPAVRWDLRPVRVKPSDLLDIVTANDFIRAGLVTEEEVDAFRETYYSKEFTECDQHPGYLVSRNGISVSKESVNVPHPSSMPVDEFTTADIYQSNMTWAAKEITLF